MARPSDTFRWLLRLLEEQHEQDLASLTQESPSSKSSKGEQKERDIAALAQQLVGLRTDKKLCAACDPATVVTDPLAATSASSADSTVNIGKALLPPEPIMPDESSLDLEQASPDDIPPLEPAGSTKVTLSAENFLDVSQVNPKNAPSIQPAGSINTSVLDGNCFAVVQIKSEDSHASQPMEKATKIAFSTQRSYSKRHSYQATKSFKLLHAWLDVARYQEKDSVPLTFASGESEIRASTCRASYSSVTLMLSGSSISVKNNCRERLDAFARPFIMDPGSIFRTAWGFASLFVLCYDIVIVPPECFIGFPPSPWMDATRWASRIFWTLDMPLNFVTGFFNMSGLELRLSAISMNYLKTWLAFDVIVVGSDWFSLAFSDVSSRASFLVTLRGVRILRLVRLLRIARLQHLVSDLLTVGNDTVVGCAGLVKISIGICVLLHVLSCFWYAIGELDNGWATRAGFTDAPFGEKYQHALYWTLTRVHGASAYEPRVTNEYAFAIFMVSFGFVVMSVVVGKTTHTVMVLVDRRKVEMQQICRKYMRTRNVSANLQLRLNKYLAHCHQKSFKEAVEYETELLQSLPILLQRELHTEIRKPLLLSIRLLREMSQRMLRMLCFEALTCVVAVNTERVFERTVTCTRLLVIEGGFLTYFSGRVQRKTRDASRPSYKTLMDWLNSDKDQDGDLKVLSRGASVSEAALWTEWAHCGELVAESDVTVLALDVSDFVPIISRNEKCLNVSINYARRYLINLNEYVDAGGQLSDILELDVDFTNIHEPLKNFDIQFEHLIFLSHFKEEAGTEAALMENDLDKMIRDDDSHAASELVTPCFLDSEDLVDLSGLRDHVRKSHNLLVMLTPGMLTRPWCLIEIVTAVRSNVNLVPVEIQRPGLQFKYPDEQYFNALCNGETLNDDAINVLAEEGIDLFELEACIRQVFLKIAVPFSPHKSTKIRQAELCGILERCVFQQSVETRKSSQSLENRADDVLVL